MVKNVPANVGDIGSMLGLERSLEKEVATHSSILAWEIPWIEELEGNRLWGSQRVGNQLVTK